MSKNKLGNRDIILILIFSLVAIIAFGLDRCRRNSVFKRGKTTNAYITKVSIHIKPTLPSIAYYYVVGGDTFYSNYNVTQGAKFSRLKELEGKTIRVMYDSINVQRNTLIINENEYR